MEIWSLNGEQCEATSAVLWRSMALQTVAGGCSATDSQHYINELHLEARHNLSKCGDDLVLPTVPLAHCA